MPGSGSARGWWTGLLALAVATLLSGCASLMSSATAGLSRSLSAGILNQDDPETVADGLPAYLLLLDGLIEGDPDSLDLLLAGSRLYGAYASQFAVDPERRKRLALKAEHYARRAACAGSEPLCAVLDTPYEGFVAALPGFGARDVPLLHALAVSWAGALQADTADWDRIADLPRIEALLERVRALDADYDGGSTFMYLGVMNCIRPESLGGRPADGSRYFEEAIARSQGSNQMARVLYAEYCARLTFDQALHDRLLGDVLAANPRAPGLTLSNTLAQRRARELLESGKDYF